MKIRRIFGVIIKLAIIAAGVWAIERLAPKSGGYIAAAVGAIAAIIIRIVTVWKRNRFSVELNIWDTFSEKLLVTKNPEALCFLVLSLAQANDWHLEIFLGSDSIGFFGQLKSNRSVTMMRCTVKGPVNKIFWKQENSLAQHISALVVDDMFACLSNTVNI
jgi:hypothetical protein